MSPAEDEAWQLHPATRVVHAGSDRSGPDRPLVPSIPMTIVHQHDNPLGLHYGRDQNRNWELLEAALSELEEGQGAVVFSSGMAAISATLEVFGVGRRIVVAEGAYAGTRERLARLTAEGRCSSELVDATDLAAVGSACRGAGLLILESLGNPLLTVPDLLACAEAARAEGAVTLVDNTFASPLLVQPLTLGADLVMHSVSKYIGGHSDLMLGAIVARDRLALEGLRYQRSNAGAIPGHLETWLALRGLRTLDVRLRRQCATAALLARRLGELAAVVRVHYPGLDEHPQHRLAERQMQGGFGAMVSIELDADAETAERVCGLTRIWVNATSLGSVESLLERRARWPGESHLSPALVRLSVGVEDVDDLFEDLVRAIRLAGLPAGPRRADAAPPPAG